VKQYVLAVTLFLLGLLGLMNSVWWMLCLLTDIPNTYSFYTSFILLLMTALLAGVLAMIFLEVNEHGIIPKYSQFTAWFLVFSMAISFLGIVLLQTWSLILAPVLNPFVLVAWVILGINKLGREG